MPPSPNANFSERARITLPVALIFSGIGIIIALTMRSMNYLASIDTEIALLKQDRAYLIEAVRSNTEAIKAHVREPHK